MTSNRGQGHLWSPSSVHTYCLQESAQLPHQRQSLHLHPRHLLPGGWRAPRHQREKSHFLRPHQHSHCSHPPPAQPPAAGLCPAHQGHLYHHHLRRHLLPLALLPPTKTEKQSTVDIKTNAKCSKNNWRKHTYSFHFSPHPDTTRYYIYSLSLHHYTTQHVLYHLQACSSICRRLVQHRHHGLKLLSNTSHQHLTIQRTCWEGHVARASNPWLIASLEQTDLVSAG